MRRADERTLFAVTLFVHHAPRLRALDCPRDLGPAALGRARPPRRPGPDRLVPGGDRLGECPRRKGGSATGPSPVDRGKTGSKIHVLTDAAGLPLSCANSGANVHDMNALKPLVTAIQRSLRRGPRRRRPAILHGDKGYDFPELSLVGLMSMVCQEGG